MLKQSNGYSIKMFISGNKYTEYLGTGRCKRWCTYLDALY